jgi:hypothetical protein
MKAWRVAAMREHEMRERIERLIRKAAVPAGVGISMAVLGCSSNSTGGDNIVPDYMALCPPDCPPDAAQTQHKDATPDSPTAMPLYMAVMPDAGAKDSATDANDAGATDANPIDDTSYAVPLYMAVIQDARGEDDAG